MTIVYKPTQQYSFVEDNMIMLENDIVDLSEPFDLTDEILQLFLGETQKRQVVRLKDNIKYPLWIYTQIKQPVDRTKYHTGRMKVTVEFDKLTGEPHLLKGDRADRPISVATLENHIRKATRQAPERELNIRFKVVVDNVVSIWGRAYSSKSTTLQLVTIYPLMDINTTDRLEDTLTNFSVKLSDATTINMEARK